MKENYCLFVLTVLKLLLGNWHQALVTVKIRSVGSLPVVMLSYGWNAPTCSITFLTIAQARRTEPLGLVKFKTETVIGESEAVETPSTEPESPVKI